MKTVHVSGRPIAAFCREPRFANFTAVPFGPIVLSFALSAEPNRIVWRLTGARLLFVPLPAALFAGCGAFETIVDGRYYFDARAGIAGIGLLVHYKGWLVDHGG